MKELIEISFSPVNAFFTIMCIIMVLYWILVIISGIDPDLFSVDFDSADVDLDADIDADTDADGQGIEGHSGFMKVLEYFNFDELPLMFIITVIFFSMWFISVNITYYLSINTVWLGFVLLIPNLIVSLFLVKLMAKPLGYLYRQVNHKGEPEIDFLGRRCKVVSSVGPQKTGMVELIVSGDPIKLYARSNTNEVIPAGQQAVIVREAEGGRHFLIEKFDY
ncbi:hypothetical protein [Flavobacterium rhizosphaerae]|uniref:DUF1449 family protein n=1 Tax=Flavobacterium rhizosphaerae TaxID=3163298 RepID=A0ABW8YV79_9FLAO